MDSLINATNKYNVSFKKKKDLENIVPLVLKGHEGKETRKKINRKIRGEKYTVHCSQPKINTFISRKLKTITDEPMEDHPEKEEKINFIETPVTNDAKDVETRDSSMRNNFVGRIIRNTQK